MPAHEEEAQKNPTSGDKNSLLTTFKNSVFNLFNTHRSVILRAEHLCAAALLVFFFFPWINIAGEHTLSGYQILSLTQKLQPHISFTGEMSCYLLYLIPILSIMTIVLGIRGRNPAFVAGLTGLLPIGYFFYYEYFRYFHPLIIQATEQEAKSSWWGLFSGNSPGDVVVFQNLEFGAYLTLLTSVTMLIVVVSERVRKSETHNQQTSSWSSRGLHVIFGEWNDLRKRQLIGILFGMLAIGCFSLWYVPSLWESAPSWSHWALKPFGKTTTIRFPSLLAALLSFCVMLSLSQRKFIDCHVNNLFGIISLVVNSWGFALIIELVMGRMDKFFEGGLIAFILVTLYALAIFGMKEIVPLSLIGIFIVLFIQLISAEAKLYIPGFFGALAIFLSLALQFTNFLPKLHLITSSTNK